jgi:hypothetical protein
MHVKMAKSWQYKRRQAILINIKRGKKFVEFVKFNIFKRTPFVKLNQLLRNTWMAVCALEKFRRRTAIYFRLMVMTHV